MLKRIVLIVAMLMLSAALVGCSCSATATTPSPAPTSTMSANAGASPSAEGNLGGQTSPSPDISIGPDLGTSPDVSTSPDAGTGTGTGSGAGGTGTGTTIPNFKEGTEVKESEVPEVKKAIEAQFAGAQIQSIKHATVDGAQVYAVEIKTGGTTQTVHVKPDGSFAQKAS